MTAVWGSIDTPEQALELLEKAVAERGADWRYRDEDAEDSLEWNGVCRYVSDDGEPLCIVGMALSLHGVPADVYGNDAGTVVTNSALRRRLNMSSDAASVFFAAQTTQDLGRTWGESLNNARSMVAAVHEDRAACAARELVTA